MQLADQVTIVRLFGLQKLLLESAQGDIAIDRVLHRGSLQRRGFLRDVGDAPVPGQVDVALVGVQLVAQQREETRLARAVGADQPGVLAGVERQVDLLEQQLGAAPQADLREADQEMTLTSQSESMGNASTSAMRIASAARNTATPL
jgi:hypothetical protein